jgi:hypothetical protein
VSEPLRYARTLVEGRLYLGLAAATGDDAPAEAETTLVEGPDAWTLRSGGDHPAEVLVPYATETEARSEGLRFGQGVSRLIDAGQWLQIAAVYARRARRESLFFAQDPSGDERYASVVNGWELARDATAEAAKFLPPGADEVPPEAFWTPMGTSAREQSPDRFTRERLESDLAFCRQSLDDFRRLHPR